MSYTNESQQHGFKPKPHPLGWTDTELAYLISTGMNAANLYRAWGYKTNRPTFAFMQRIYNLGYVDKRNHNG